MKKILLFIACVTLCVTLHAQTNQNALQRGWGNVKSWTKVESGDLFKAGETHLDISGTYTSAEPGGIGNLFKNDFKKGVFGLSAGITFFPSKYLGLGTDVVCTDLHNPSSLLIDELNVNTVLRYPISRVAPSITASVGRNFESGLYSFQAGPGIELRVNRSIGLFLDSRFQWQMDSKNDRVLTRAGVRFVF